jgi:hypothetical protein
VKTVKSLLKKGDDFNLSLLVYRSTPLECGKSPAEIFLGRKIRSNLPIMPTLLLQKDKTLCVEEQRKQTRKQKLRYDRHVRELPELTKGDTVRLRDRSDSTWSEKGIVQKKVAPRSYIVETADGVCYRRNRRDILKTVENGLCPDPSVDIQYDGSHGSQANNAVDEPAEDPIEDQPTDPPAARKSERLRVKPKRLIEEI